jgi:hypothetical protein
MRIEPRTALAGGIGTKRRADRVHVAFGVVLADLPYLNRPKSASGGNIPCPVSIKVGIH